MILLADITSPLDEIDSISTSAIEMDSLYEPLPVAFSFDAPGWTILFILFGIIVCVILFKYIRSYVRNRYRRLGIMRLKELEQNPSSSTLQDVFIVLKQVAITSYGREKIAALHGTQWLQFMEVTGKDVSVLQYEQEINDALYREIAPEQKALKEIISVSCKWILSHA